MTEYSYQLGRRIMAQANYRRGIITSAKGNVTKWTQIEYEARKNLKHAQADGALKQLEKALKKLDEERAKFAALKFPESDLPEPKPVRCQLCGSVFAAGEEHICPEDNIEIPVQDEKEKFRRRQEKRRTDL
jgi:hypothetical protein